MIARLRQPLQQQHHHAGKRVVAPQILFGHFLDSERVLEFRNRNDAVEEPRAVGAFDRHALVFGFGLKFSGNGFQHIARGHESHDFAELIDDKRQRHDRALEVFQKLHTAQRFGNVNGRKQILGKVNFLFVDDLLGHAADNVPTMMNYTTLLGKDSMYNTPPCWCIYMTGLVLKYLENDIGGLANMQKINEAKAKVLYDYLDGQDFFNNPVEHRYRSTMNVTFTSPDPDMDKKFCAEAAEAGFVNLKGHRLVGGMRASIYNAMPTEGVEKLVDFMEKFRKANA